MSLTGVCAAGESGSSGAADRMCCRELMFAIGFPGGGRLGWVRCSGRVRRVPYGLIRAYSISQGNYSQTWSLEGKEEEQETGRDEQITARATTLRVGDKRCDSTG